MNLIFRIFLISLFFAVGNSTLVFTQSVERLQVKLINVDDLSRIINENKEHPLLINVWATWCAPCREEFPDLIKISKIYGDKIKVIGISVDYDDLLDSKVIPFLTKHNAEFENYLLKVVEPEDFINLLSKKWSGAIPATFIYDDKGDQKEILIGKHDYKSFEQSVKKVIN